MTGLAWAGPSGVALTRLRHLLAQTGLPAVVLTTPGAVGWCTAGLNLPIDRTAGFDVVWVLVTAEGVRLITTGVEAPRIAADYLTSGQRLSGPEASIGGGMITVPWWLPEGFADAVVAATGVNRCDIASDGHPAFGHDLSVELTTARLALDEAQQADLRRLGSDATRAVEQALRSWRPGESDYAVAGRIAGAVEACGAQAPVLLVGGDERLAAFRHPVAVGAAMRRRVMAVLVASRGGQHVALTRYATAGPDAEFATALAPVQRIHRAALAACVPGATAGTVLTALASAYAEEGAPEAWRDHYQGGPIGYAQREFEIAPEQTSSPWWATPLPSGCAVAWNPSLPGGAKDEDTFLLHDDGLEPITISDDWPLLDDALPARPAPLIVGD